jgi:hypothetical protein
MKYNRDVIYALAIGLLISLVMLGTAHAGTTNEIGKVVLINDAGQTRPAQSIATPSQVTSAADTALEAKSVATSLLSIAQSTKDQADAQEERLQLYSTNFTITSACFVEGVGAVNFDPSNQTMRVYYFTVNTTNVIIRGLAKITPLGSAIPLIEWRGTLGTSGSWTNLPTYTATEISVPAQYAADYEKAYEYTVPRPGGSSAFFRMVDMSSGISGSGWYWLVYNKIIVNIGGKYYEGQTSVQTNVVGSVTNVLHYKTGVLCNPTPL